MNTQTTLVILKPDCVDRGLIGRVVSRFEDKGLEIVAMQLTSLPRATVEKHYAEHAARPFFGELCGFMTQGPVVLMALRGPHAISVTRALLGSTKGFEANPGTIRGDFGLSNQANLVHASDSPESAERELALFFPDGGLIEGATPRSKWW